MKLIFNDNLQLIRDSSRWILSTLNPPLIMSHSTHFQPPPPRSTRSHSPKNKLEQSKLNSSPSWNGDDDDRKFECGENWKKEEESAWNELVESIPRMRYYYAEKMIIVENIVWSSQQQQHWAALTCLNNKNLFLTKRLQSQREQHDTPSVTCLEAQRAREKQKKNRSTWASAAQPHDFEYHHHNSSRTCRQMGVWWSINIFFLTLSCWTSCYSQCSMLYWCFTLQTWHQVISHSSLPELTHSLSLSASNACECFWHGTSEREEFTFIDFSDISLG